MIIWIQRSSLGSFFCACCLSSDASIYATLLNLFSSLQLPYVLGFKVLMSGVSNQSPRMSRGFDEPILWNGME